MNYKRPVSTTSRQQFRVTKLFISGFLAGLTYTFTDSRPWTVGWVCEKPIGGSPYRIIECVELI